jgi:OOP family OmpA-OmpF porin
MKKNLLGLALLGAVSLSQVAVAQEYDNRWYLSGTVGVLGTDDERDASNSELYGIGIGKRLSPNFGLELSIDQSNPTIDIDPFNGDIEWDLTSVFLDGRYYFVKEGRTWDPYLVGGLGATDHSINGGSGIDGTEFAGKVGAGIESDRRKRVDFRVEAGMRYDSHEEVIRANNEINEYGPFWDYYASASLLVKLGDLPVPVVAPTCDTLDGDGDGVNDCNDKCPDSTAGQTIGADGCPVKLTIDLKGVNFDFDKATLRPDAVVILDEAVAVLAKYPELRFEVAGHTDLCGDETYNQGLSQRRAQAVYDYLTSKGIDAARMVGPNGYGESRPLESTEQTSPACKSETNRRTELNVQN